MKRIFAILVLAFITLAFTQNSSVKVSFSSETEKYAQATTEYQEIWNREGKELSKLWKEFQEWSLPSGR